MVLEGLMGHTFNNLQQFYVYELQDLYDAERQILDALPQMSRKASSPELKDAFNRHLEQTRAQASRLEQILDDLGESHDGMSCKGMEGIIDEGQEIVSADGDAYAIDAALITAANRVEHYEIAGYGAAKAHAHILGFKNHEALLGQSLEEEGQTDKLLTSISDQLNPRAPR